MLQDENHQTRLAVLTAISQVSTDLPRLVALLADADDDTDARERLQEAYKFTPVQAQAVLDAQLQGFNRARRAAREDQLRVLREALSQPWDPPLTLGVAIQSPRQASLVIEGDEHRVEGRELDDTVVRIVDLVRHKLALPRRRRVSVTVSTGLVAAPTTILIDPVSHASYFYGDEEAH
ncbi:hypothetical protein ACI782_06420 [Geodermatophilus sp. SYSU D00703]